MEQPLYTVTQKPTKQDFIQFNRTVSNREFHFWRTVVIVNIVLLLLWGTIIFSSGMPNTSLLCFLGAAAALGIVYTNWSMFRNRDKRAAKLYDQNKVFASAGRVEVRLFDDHFEALTDHSQETVTYDKLYKIIETPTHFYFMYSKMQGVIVAKQGEGLCEFVHGVKEKYQL